MQSLIFLWIQLRMTQQYLREEIFDPVQTPANLADPNQPTGPVTPARDSIKQVRTIPSAMRPRVGSSPRQKLFRLGVIAACIFMVAFVQQTSASQLKELPPKAPGIPQAPVPVYPEKTGVGQTVAEETVTIIHPEQSEAATSRLPGQLSAYTDAPIYAQTSGYLKSWYFDIGAKVKANDILAEIDTPEVDQELAQAKAQFQVDTVSAATGAGNLQTLSAAF